MDPEEQGVDEAEKTPLTVKVAVGLTVAWFAALVTILVFSQPCEDALTAPWWDLFHRNLACRPANEVGDFLSGGFAPVAFMWLVATVFIQAQELKAQRRELKLARDVATESSEAMKAQAEEARLSATHLGEQARLISLEASERRQKSVDDDVEEELKIIVSIAETSELRLPYVQYGEVNKMALTWNDEVKLNFEEKIRTITGRAAIYVKKCNSDEWLPIRLNKASEWAERMIDLLGRVESMSPSKARRLKSFKLEHLINALDLASHAPEGQTNDGRDV